MDEIEDPFMEVGNFPATSEVVWLVDCRGRRTPGSDHLVRPVNDRIKSGIGVTVVVSSAPLIECPECGRVLRVKGGER